MSKPIQTETPATSVELEPALTISEFCARMSETVRRPELIGAFAAIETGAGRIQSSASDFASRFAAFVNQPA